MGVTTVEWMVAAIHGRGQNRDRDGRLKTQSETLIPNLHLDIRKNAKDMVSRVQGPKMIMVIHFNSTELSPLPPKAIWSNDIK